MPRLPSHWRNRFAPGAGSLRHRQPALDRRAATRDREIRALDVDTGKVLWKAQVDAALEGTPAVYEVNGKQYIVFCAAARATTHTHGIPGHPASTAPIPGAYVAFALP